MNITDPNAGTAMPPVEETVPGTETPLEEVPTEETEQEENAEVPAEA